MTIYKPKNGDRKAVKTTLPSPEVVPEGVPLSDGKKKIDQLSTRLIVISAARRRRNGMIMILALMLVMCIVAISVAAGLFLYRHMQNKPYMGSCEVRYHEGSYAGQFQEKVEIDKAFGVYEKLEVPPVLDSKRSTIVHDFEKNLTAIVDRDHGRCFIMNLNRTLVEPPQNFLDLLFKFQSGYYIPDAEVVREKYRVAVPEVKNLEPFGIYIWNECQYFETYRLVRDDQPFAMSRKRSAKPFKGTFNLGETMGKYIQFVEIMG
jgi:hypothetical protein